MSVTPVHCEQMLSIFPFQPGCHLPNSPCPAIFELFPARESLVRDFLAGGRKIDNLFYSVISACTHSAYCVPNSFSVGYVPGVQAVLNTKENVTKCTRTLYSVQFSFLHGSANNLCQSPKPQITPRRGQRGAGKVLVEAC